MVVMAFSGHPCKGAIPEEILEKDKPSIMLTFWELYGDGRPAKFTQDRFDSHKQHTAKKTKRKGTKRNAKGKS